MNDGGPSSAVQAPLHSERRADQRLARRGGAIECLRLPAWVFGLVGGLRSHLYDAGLLPQHRLPVPVLSVGNITAGGTGKTPMVTFLARELARRGRRVGLLARGYGARRGEDNDESRMVAAELPGVPQALGSDRLVGARSLLARGVDAIVLDDGFQHRRLARDLDLVLVDATRPWGLPRDPSGDSLCALLPRGLLRETPRALARADVLVVTRADQVSPAWLESLERELEALAPGVPQLRAVHRPSAVRLPDGSRHPVNYLAGRDFDLASGIGNPEAFARTVRELGGRVHAERRFPDHHDFQARDLAGLGEQGRVLLCTAKDAVKLAGLGVAPAVLEIELAVIAGARALEARLDALLLADLPARPQGRVP